MPTQYVNCQSGERLNARSARAVYRVTVERTNELVDAITSPFTIGARPWDEVVNSVIDAMPTLGGIAFPLGDPTLGNNTAVMDLRVGANPGSATVGQLVGGLDDLSIFLDVTRVEWSANVPGNSVGGSEALSETRGATETAAQADADVTHSIFPDPLKDIGKTLESAVILAAVAVALYFAWKASK